MDTASDQPSGLSQDEVCCYLGDCEGFEDGKVDMPCNGAATEALWHELCSMGTSSLEVACLGRSGWVCEGSDAFHVLCCVEPGCTLALGVLVS